jgi:hypothetical protein
VKFVSVFLAVFVFGALAQTPSAPVVIKGECGIVTGLHFSPNVNEPLTSQSTCLFNRFAPLFGEVTIGRLTEQNPSPGLSICRGKETIIVLEQRR